MQISANDFFNTLAYGQQSQETVNQFRDAAARMANYLPEQFKHVQQRIYNTASRLADVNYRHAMKVATAHVQSTWEGDFIRRANSIEDIQAASPVNARWNMAEPTYRALYHQGQANGYGSDYIDTQPDAIGEDHLDYRRVTHGQWVEKEDDDESYLCAYDTDVSNDEDEENDLTLSQQLDIQSNWVRIRREAMNKRFDPGCPFGGNL